MYIGIYFYKKNACVRAYRDIYSKMSFVLLTVCE